MGTEDIASDRHVAAASSALPHTQDDGKSAAAKLPWGRDATPTKASAAEAEALLESQQSDGKLPHVFCYGVVGILRVFHATYLLVITARTPAGDYLRPGQSVYKCTGVMPIPLTFAGAKATMASEMKRQADGQKTMPSSSSSSLSSSGSKSDSSDSDADVDDDVVTPAVVSRNGLDRDPFSASMGAAATLNAKQKKAWGDSLARSASEGDQPGQAAHEPEDQEHAETTEAPDAIQTDPQQLSLTADERWHEATQAELEDKVVKETARQYARGEVWFTYDVDLTSPAQRKQDALDGDSPKIRKDAPRGKDRSEGARSASISSLSGPVPMAEPWATLPLWRRADRRFWHNEHLSRDFAQAGLHNFVLPMMQGFFQVTRLPVGTRSPAASSFDPAGDAMIAVTEAASLPRIEAHLLIVSRRSKERAGLRYQRRGVNDQGQVANFVESEQILCVRRGDEEIHLFSFVQFRGSIPLYWRQDPFSMKPPPLLERSPEENHKAFAKHFEQQLTKYNKVICINLAEQHGKEGAITTAYKEGVEHLANPSVVYKAFDFHEECKGMRFERVSKLIDQLKDVEMKDMDCFWKCMSSSGSETVYSRQSGAFRVSCLDCLDRTNVVQSAFARHVLGVQLERLGVRVVREKDERDEAFEFAFNDSWANNGDMISQIYAGTKALKGDFTRTGKRNLMGMMNDATNSVYRMVRGAVSDFFKQTVIDFQYGYATLATLEKYNANLAAPDPSETNRLARVRASAIDACARNVVANDEKVLAGWTLFSPIEPNHIETPKLEEKVVLLTSKALYSCGYDFTSEKLAEYSRILLGDIVGIKRGLYILSPHEGYHPDNHWGLIVSYINEERRLNTASMRSLPSAAALSPGATNFIAFRAVVNDASSATANLEASSRFLDSAERCLRLQSKESARKGLSSKLGVKQSVDFNEAKLKDGHRSRSATGAGLPTSHSIIDLIVESIVDQCILAGACDDDNEEFLKEETIQRCVCGRHRAFRNSCH